mmetsp:Transcript_40406/g.109198  ORF Transcript_40406/g.109198 Transcript_40406/m.109198 type:complete len:204 (+) Transcript_40406:451-1062(+)
MAVCSHHGCCVTGLMPNVIHRTFWKNCHDHTELRTSMTPVLSMSPSSEAIKWKRRSPKSQSPHPSVRFLGKRASRAAAGALAAQWLSSRSSYHLSSPPCCRSPWGPTSQRRTRSRSSSASRPLPASPGRCASAIATKSSSRTSWSMKKESQSIQRSQSCLPAARAVSRASTFDQAGGLCEGGSVRSTDSGSSKMGALSYITTS